MSQKNKIFKVFACITIMSVMLSGCGEKDKKKEASTTVEITTNANEYLANVDENTNEIDKSGNEESKSDSSKDEATKSNSSKDEATKSNSSKDEESKSNSSKDEETKSNPQKDETAKSNFPKDETNKSNSQTNEVAIQAGADKIYIDEVRYYAYKTQATYEVYYLSKDKTLNWSQKMSEGVTLLEAVKSQVLDDICQRQALYQKAGQYKVKLNDEQEQEVQAQVDNYLTNSNDNMLKIVNITKESLTKIYEKEKIAELVSETMEKGKVGSVDEMYKTWKKENKVDTKECWDNIDFSQKIIEE